MSSSVLKDLGEALLTPEDNDSGVTGRSDHAQSRVHSVDTLRGSVSLHVLIPR